jgi:hypothetical protein
MSAPNLVYQMAQDCDQPTTTVDHAASEKWRQIGLRSVKCCGKNRMFWPEKRQVLKH